MWSDQQIGHVPQRRVGSQRLLWKYIKRRATNSFFTQSYGERGFIHQRATADVDQAGTGLHEGQASGIGDLLRAIRNRRCQHDVIRLPKDFVDLGWPEDGIRTFTSLLWMLAHRDYPHAQGLCTLHNGPSDAAEADLPNGGARNFPDSRQLIPQNVLSPHVLFLQAYRPRNF